LAASVVAIVVAIFAVGNPLALFANAKASLAGTAAGLSGAPNQVAAIQRVPEPARAAPEPVVAVRTASADPTAQEAQPNLGARAVSPTARSGPTRDEIASAFKTARQGQPEAALPPAAVPVVTVPVAAAPAAAVPAAAPPAARRIDAEELATLLKRARSLIAIGDIAPARLLLKRAADAQEATAALLLAQTYDPAVLGKQDMRSIAPDPALAREWYQKAARYGSVDAQQRLSQMQN
jgi:TPR repeat protein